MTKWKNRINGSSRRFYFLQAALDNGADSIYFGVEQLNMRAGSFYELYDF